MPGLSIRAAAKELGLSDTALRKANRQGRCTFNEDGTVDVEKVRLQLAANNDPVRGGDRRNPAPPSMPHQSFGAGWQDAAAANRSTGTFQAARAAREAFEAKLAELRYREAIGEYLRKADVELEFSGLFAAVRERLLAVADRVGPLARGAATDAEAIAVIDREVRLALQVAVDQHADTKAPA